jgi:DNA-binding transcriptional regulator YdaS (Cro superfamily)
MTLIEYLAKEHMNHSAFAHRMAVPPSTVHRWVHGKRRPSIQYLFRIEEATGGLVRVSDFYPNSEAAE